MSALLRVENAAVRHGAVLAVDNVSFEVRPGEIVALIGANGAGKSSLMSAIAGTIALNGGDIRLNGHSLVGLAPWRRARLGIGVCPEGRRVFPGLNVRENLIAGGSGAGGLEARIDEVYALFPALREYAASPAWQLSGGQQQMLAVGRALIRDPLLVLLDEPTLGLAPGLARDVLRAMRRVASKTRAVLIADQNAAMALPAADRAIVLRHGRIAAHGRAADLLRAPDLADSLLGG
jgi:branched-chain amino acid transport system ATP-binding protein